MNLPLAPRSGVRVVALGGLGAIGRNMTVFEHQGKLLIVDCGVLFPEESHPGVDLILPDFSYLADRIDDIVGVVLTHGHEDHIGALPYLLRSRADIPVYGTELTLALLEPKLAEHRIKNHDLRVVGDGARADIGPFTVGFLAVTHSIPDAVALSIQAGDQLIVHTGDFKIDQLPLDNRITDLNAFARLGDEGVDLLLADSTNAEVPGFLQSESEITDVIDQVFARAQGRIIVASFASHIHRIQQVFDLAAKHNRKVALVGRSMVRNMGIARDLGYLRVPDRTLVSVSDLADLPAEQAVLVSTGSQGEPMAALSRMANQNHAIEVGHKDTVLLASSLIPGNENSVNRVINGLSRLGATVVHQGNAKVHVSGHASAGELLTLYNIVKPFNVVPVHGEYRHLIANAALAEKAGVPADNVFVIDNGTVLDLRGDELVVAGKTEVGFVYVDGSTVGDVTEALLKDRRILGEEGFLSVVVVVDTVSGKVVAGPEVHERGFPIGDDDFAEIQDTIRKRLEKALRYGNKADHHELQQIVRRTIGRWVAKTHERRPMIVPVIVEA